MKRFQLLWVAPTVLLFAAFLAPVIVGSETFFLRDVMSVHAGLRAGLDAADGTMPLVDPLRGGGQPAAGNPNLVALHPSALLHRVLPFFAAFDAHLWLHLLAAPFALFWLARELGLGRRGAWAAAVVWGFSGFVLSQAAFFNVVAAVATAPALAAAAVGATRRLAAGGAAGRHLAATGALTALVLVAGDPVTAAAALVAAGALAAAEGWAAGERRPAALGWTAAALACGALLALPQIVELLRVLPASARGAGYGEAMRTAGSWDPRQAIEQLLPLAFGRPDLLASDQQAGSFWGYRFHQGSWSFHFSLYPGLAAFALAAAAGRTWRLPGALGRVGRRGWLLVAAGLFFALGAFNPL
ncbi:MAG TPA: hypothetical protein VKU40_02300, partial [Thermoanaerobaculia bacterium]|nr:hypothetical protein [Thermoanaerobaculia bacterium]